jgi:hypothetical protein
MKDRLESWWFRSDSQEKAQFLMVGCFVTLTLWAIIRGVVELSRGGSHAV